jgi:hypothetical protein
MFRFVRAVVLIWVWGLLVFPGRATSFLPLTTQEHIQRASAIFRGTVVEVQSFRNATDGQIYTRTALRVNEVFKGKLPAQVKVVHRGGIVGGIGVADGFAPEFRVGEERLLLVSRRADGFLFALRGDASALLVPAAQTGGALGSSPTSSAGQALLDELRTQTTGGPLSGSDVTDQAASPSLVSAPAAGDQPLLASGATNLLIGSDGIPARFILPDRGEPIPYLIDADYLPAGITQTQAVGAVQAAIAAWTNATSVRYVFAGIQSFGQSPYYITNGDGLLRIQLHDHYNFLGTVSGGDVLGEGGHLWYTTTTPSGWTMGGNVSGNDFHRAVNGFVILDHTNAAMQNLSTFTEVLTHEVGHTIGLGHSSQNPNETNSYLSQAVMYFMVHADGRGAQLNGWDTNVSRQVHPPVNTPPYCYDRFIYAVTQPSGVPDAPGVNSVQLRGYDLQSTNLSLVIGDGTANAGTFTLDGNVLEFVPGDYYKAPMLDPASGEYYDLVYARFSDRTNISPFATINVIYLGADSASEGIPDDWRLEYFGNADPNVGINHHATNDFDGDGLSNLQEFLLGSNPADKNSNLRIISFDGTNLQWQTRGYEVYELYGSTNLANWTRVMNPIVPTNTLPATNFSNIGSAIGSATIPASTGSQKFFRIYKVP